MSSAKLRNQSLDLIKVIAMVGVIALHCQLYLPRNYHTTFFLSTLAAGFPIPLFFMVSGYLMAGRNSGIKYSVRKIAWILKFLIEFTIIYWLIFRMSDGTSLLTALKFVPLAMLQEGPLPIFWYFGAMCILYACLPIMNYLDRKYDKFLLVFTALLFIIVNITFILNCTVGLEKHIPQSLRIWNWLFYFSLGGILKKYNKALTRHKVNGLHILITAILFVALYSAAHHLFPVLSNTDQAYGNFVCTAYALSVFIYCIQRNYQGNKTIMALSPLFLPVYSLHLFAYEYYFRYVNLDFLGEAEPVFDFIIVAAITISISWIIMKTPLINRIFRI